MSFSGLSLLLGLKGRAEQQRDAAEVRKVGSVPLVVALLAPAGDDVETLGDDGRRGAAGAALAVLSRIAQLDQRTALAGPMSALGGSGRAAPKEEVRVCEGFRMPAA